MTERWSWRTLAGTLAVAACGAGLSAHQGPASRPPELPVTRLDDRTPAADLDGPRTITLSVARPMPVADLLRLLVRATPFGLVTDGRVEGRFSGELKSLTMRQAIEAVLFGRDLDYDVRGSLIRVFPRRAATRLFDVNYLDVRRSSRTTTAAGADPARAAITTAADPDFFGELSAGVERLLSPAGRAHVDRVAGLVQVTDFADRLDQVAVYLEAAQLRATRQVRIDTRVLEVTLHDQSRSVDWTEVAARSGGAIGAALPGAAGVRVADFEALLKAIDAQGSVRLIAAPRLVAMNNEPALLRLGPEPGAPAATALEGLTLAVTAQVDADGIVQLHVAPTYAERSGPGTEPATLDVSAADTRARVADGETLVVSGFLKGRTPAGPRVDLVILLTPTVVAPGTAAGRGSK